MITSKNLTDKKYAELLANEPVDFKYSELPPTPQSEFGRWRNPEKIEELRKNGTLKGLVQERLKIMEEQFALHDSDVYQKADYKKRVKMNLDLIKQQKKSDSLPETKKHFNLRKVAVF